MAAGGGRVVEVRGGASVERGGKMEWSVCADMNPRCGQWRYSSIVAAQGDGKKARLLRASRRPRRDSSIGSQAIECRRHDFGEARGRRQARELGRVDPTRLVEFLVEDRLARAPAGGKAPEG